MTDLSVETQRGVLLPGVLFTAGETDWVVINITGIHGNFYSNPFYYNIGETLAADGIDFVYALTSDAFPQMETVNVRTGEKVIIGSATENFDDMDDDVAAYVNWAKAAGYRKIILCGHSLGVNKVIYYLSEHPDSGVAYFLFLSPANVDYMVRNVPEEQRQYIREQVAAGNGHKMLPFRFMYWLDCTAQTAYQWLYNEDIRNVHVDKDKDFSQAEKIDLSGAMCIGTMDNFTYGDPTDYLKMLNDHLPSKDSNQLIFLAGTDHAYWGKHRELTTEILRVVNGWREKDLNDKAHATKRRQETDER